MCCPQHFWIFECLSFSFASPNLFSLSLLCENYFSDSYEFLSLVEFLNWPHLASHLSLYSIPIAGYPRANVVCSAIVWRARSMGGTTRKVQLLEYNLKYKLTYKPITGEWPRGTPFKNLWTEKSIALGHRKHRLYNLCNTS